MTRRLISFLVAALFALGSLTLTPAFAQEETTPSAEKKVKKEKKEPSLYSRLGRRQGLMKVLDDFLANVQADNRINKFFADTAQDPKRLESLKNSIYSQICQASGGRCKYKGKEMNEAQKEMNITDAHFSAIVENLSNALDKNSVQAKEKSELLAIFAPMKSEIIAQLGQ